MSFRLLLVTGLVFVLPVAARAEFSVAACDRITDDKEKQLCQRKEVEKLGPMYFSVFEPDGKRHRVRLENSDNPCKDIAKDGEFHVYRDRREMAARTPYRRIHCKAGKLTGSESGLPAPKSASSR